MSTLAPTSEIIRTSLFRLASSNPKFENMSIAKDRAVVFDWFYKVQAENHDYFPIIDTSSMANDDHATGIDEERVLGIFREFHEKDLVRRYDEKSYWYTLTSKGIAVGEAGGYDVFVQQQLQAETDARELRDTQLEKLRGDLRQQQEAMSRGMLAKQVAFFQSTTEKNRWSFYTAVVALIISLLGLLGPIYLW